LARIWRSFFVTSPGRCGQFHELMGTAHLTTALAYPIVTVERSCIEAFQGEFDYLCRALRRLGVRPEDVEDEVHEVFLVLSRKWPEYDSSRPLRPYLFGIAFRVVGARKRRRRLELKHTVDEPAEPVPGPEEALEASHVRALVLRALARVPLPRRAVLVMHDIEEVPMRDVAQALSMPLFTGYSRLRKARREFEAALTALRQEPREP
jgi:RNA polymerase sigma-70 factor, ECF subfamily